jgi:O-antigen ligase
MHPTNEAIQLTIAALGACLIVSALGFLSLGTAFWLGMRRGALAIILARSSCDAIFTAIKDIIGSEFGPGAIINAIVLGLAVAFFLESPALLGSAFLPMWGGFLTAALTSAIASPEPAKATKALVWLVSYAAIFAIPFGLVRSREWALRCFTAVMWSSIIPVSYAFVEFFSGWATTEDRVGVKSTFTHPNFFAFYLVIVLSVILFVLRSKLTAVSTRARSALLIYIPTILILIVLTGARGAWVATAIVVLIYAGMLDRRFLICLVLVPLIPYLPGVEERLQDLQSGNVDVGYARLNSYAWRELLWDSTLDWLKANLTPISFFFGNGLESFEHYMPEFFPRVGQQRTGAHNVFLQVFFEMGFFGLVTYVSLFVVLLWKLKRGYTLDKAGTIMMMSVMVAYLVSSYSENMLDSLVVDWYFWFVMGVSCALYRLVSNQQVAQSPLGKAILPTGSRAVPRWVSSRDMFA